MWDISVGFGLVMRFDNSKRTMEYGHIRRLDEEILENVIQHNRGKPL